MPEVNKTSMILGMVWVAGSYVLIRTVFADWALTVSPGFIPVIIVAPVFLIKILFENIFKYDFFNKNYKKNKNRGK